MTLQEYANAGRKLAVLYFIDSPTTQFWNWNGPGWYAKEYISKVFGKNEVIRGKWCYYYFGNDPNNKPNTKSVKIDGEFRLSDAVWFGDLPDSWTCYPT